MNSRMNDKRVGLVILLSFCVLLQMLGVPAPMLDPGGSFDIGESSVLEGWSIHVRYALPPPSSGFTIATDIQPLLHVPILAGALFRPPLCC